VTRLSRCHLLQLRISKPERLRLREAALRSERTVSEFVRHAVREQLRREATQDMRRAG
jgi:hypothetical protein